MKKFLCSVLVSALLVLSVPVVALAGSGSDTLSAPIVSEIIQPEVLTDNPPDLPPFCS